ncbi:MAG: MFS transporter [Flavobacteriales bacterium CG18_big_fil_WC_8_21_14_2_50_32_9]|nr:MAG: MFS transporter [Flavobacteriales bacterium CG18_big_fil_WC_8_21_14_2_50_32_9]PJC63115.1 MAG: MFS transporter [Flavobacteriales bacterium CG_4_9_14_0_2_um_filter_32_27]
MKNKKALYLLLSANAVSGVAQGISMLAIPWYFADVLNQSSDFGIMYAITTMLTLFWGLYVGTLIDKYSRKNIFLILSIVGFSFIGSISFYGFYHGELSTISIGAVFCYTMFVYNIHYPTLYAFGQEITEKKDYRKINSLIEVQGQSTSIIAGAFAAVLITGINAEFLTKFGLENFISLHVEPWKMHEIFLLDALTYLIAFFLILLIKYQPIFEKVIDSGNILNRLKSGILYLKENPLLFQFGIGSFAIFVIVLIHIHQLVPIYISNHLNGDASIYATAEILQGLGALVAGLSIHRIFSKTNTVKAIIILMIVTFIVLEILVFTKSAYLLVFSCFLLGIANSGTRILRITYLFNHIPNHLIGRTGSVFHSINVFLRFSFIALFAMSFFTTENNIIWSYFIGGFFILISLFPLLFYYKKLVTLKQPD